MKKQSKITVKHFLNKRLKPKLIDNKEKYPLYVQIIFQTKTTQIKSQAFKDIGIETSFLTDLELNANDYFLIKERENIESIILKFEQKSKEINFSVFSEIYKKYTVLMSELIEKYLYNLFLKEAKEKKNSLPFVFINSSYETVYNTLISLNSEIDYNFSELYRNSKLAYEIFTSYIKDNKLCESVLNMQFIDWEFGNGKELFIEFGKKYIHTFEVENEIKEYYKIVENVDFLIKEHI